VGWTVHPPWTPLDRASQTCLKVSEICLQVSEKMVGESLTGLVTEGRKYTSCGLLFDDPNLAARWSSDKHMLVTLTE